MQLYSLVKILTAEILTSFVVYYIVWAFYHNLAHDYRVYNFVSEELNPTIQDSSW